MKRKIILLLTLTALLLFLTSCEFVRFTYFEKKDAELTERREELLSTLCDSFNADYYIDENKIRFEILFQDAINELNEATTVEALDEIYDRHYDLLVAIERSLSAMIKTICENVRLYASPDDYRDAEKAALQTLVTEYRDKITRCASADEAESLFRSFKIEVYGLKTDLAYYTEELSEMKQAFKDALAAYLDYADYRESEQGKIADTVAQFSEEAESIDQKERLTERYAHYQSLLLAIPTAKSLYQAELSTLCDELCQRAIDEIDHYDLTPTLSTGELKATLLATEEKEAAKVYLARYLITLARNNSGALSLVRAMSIEAIENGYRREDYRENEQNEIAALAGGFKSELADCATAEQALALIDEFGEALQKIETNEALWLKENDAFQVELTERYGTDLLSPPEDLTTASSYEELAAIIDYYAFYQTDYDDFLRPTFRVKIAYPHKDAQYEINEVYWYCELIRSAVGITGYFESDGNHLVITLIPYAIATVTNVADRKPLNRNESLVTLNPDKSFVKRSDDFTAFAYRQNEKTLSGIWNTQQLWYALEQGYRPICVEGSPAAITLARAEEILRDIVSDTMTVEEKTFAIFSWFSQNVTYDLQYLPYLYPEDREHYPDSMASTLASFHAEGALFDNYAVCEGFAKAYLIMLRIEGIEAYRLLLHRYADNAIDNHGNEGYGSHAILAIRGSDGLFYYSDVEQCYVYNNNKCPKYHQFWQIRKHQTPYENAYILYYDDLPYAETVSDVMLEGLTYNGYPIHVTDRDTVRKMLDAFAAEAGTVCLSLFSSERTPFNLEDVIKEDGRFQYNTYCYNGFNEYILYIR